MADNEDLEAAGRLDDRGHRVAAAWARFMLAEYWRDLSCHHFTAFQYFLRRRIRRTFYIFPRWLNAFRALSEDVGIRPHITVRPWLW